MPHSSSNNYFNVIILENSLLLANDRIKSLECLLASKDFVIYHMSMCNAYMARPPNFSVWKPPLPNYPPPQREDTEAPEIFSQSQQFKPPFPAEFYAAASSKVASVESQMRQGGGGVLTDNQPQKPSFTSPSSVKGHLILLI